MKKSIDFIKFRKIALIIAGCVMLAGIICNVLFGTQLDINFKGGTMVSYSYTGKLDKSTVSTVAAEALGKKVTVDLTSDFSGDTKLVNITLVADESISTEKLQSLDKAMTEKFAGNKIAKSSSNSVDATVGKGFFVKCLFATVLGALFVTLYVGLRFRRLGGVSAAAFALLALVHDIIIAYFAYVVFRFPLDDNFIAVLLTLFGYSLNGTIVVYDRIRENKRLYGDQKTISELVNISVNQTFTRNLFTSLTTFLTLASICVVAWVGGVTSILSFVLPMAVGIVAGCFSSVFLSTPMWALWREKHGDPAERKKERKAKRAAKKAARAKAKKAKRK